MKLFKKHKKDILKFCREYEKLSMVRDAKVTFKPITCKVRASWDSDTTLSADADYISTCLEDEFYNHPPREIVKINNNIKSFCKKVDMWGKKHFKNKDYLWDNVFRIYSSAASLGERFEDVCEFEWI